MEEKMQPKDIIIYPWWQLILLSNYIFPRETSSLYQIVVVSIGQRDSQVAVRMFCWGRLEGVSKGE